MAGRRPPAPPLPSLSSIPPLSSFPSAPCTTWAAACAPCAAWTAAAPSSVPEHRGPLPAPAAAAAAAGVRTGGAGGVAGAGAPDPPAAAAEAAAAAGVRSGAAGADPAAAATAAGVPAGAAGAGGAARTPSSAPAPPLDVRGPCLPLLPPLLRTFAAADGTPLLGMEFKGEQSSSTPLLHAAGTPSGALPGQRGGLLAEPQLLHLGLVQPKWAAGPASGLQQQLVGLPACEPARPRMQAAAAGVPAAAARLAATLRDLEAKLVEAKLVEAKLARAHAA
ncbi:hypothetical protein PVAP13_3NG182963 [Panicum virgatum]|uniref:Uncharacterized protein n=1 Tax=Panicum virgatum TaxID=38727 RepID=A0A8T0UFK9_PANVG|nr:hypothetical protein PVAP13_3NG182963 [Panicum virgatum]